MIQARQWQPLPTPPGRGEAIGHAAWVKAEKREHSSHRFVDHVSSRLPSQHHYSTALPSPKRYEKRYEAERWANFVEHPSHKALRLSPLQAHLSATIAKHSVE